MLDTSKDAFSTISKQVLNDMFYSNNVIVLQGTYRHFQESAIDFQPEDTSHTALK